MRRLIEIATERRVTITMLMVAIGLFGLVSLSRGSIALTNHTRLKGLAAGTASM